MGKQVSLWMTVRELTPGLMRNRRTDNPPRFGCVCQIRYGLCRQILESGDFLEKWHRRLACEKRPLRKPERPRWQ